VQIGPRFVLNPIRIFAGAFGGPTLYQNPSYDTPTALRRLAKQRLSTKYVDRKVRPLHMLCNESGVWAVSCD